MSDVKNTHHKCCRGCGDKGMLLFCYWDGKLEKPLWKSVWRFLKILDMELTAIPSFSISHEELKLSFYKDTCIPMFSVAQFTIAKLWSQCRCSSTEGWMKKLWSIYTMKFYSGRTKNEILWLAAKWIMLSKINQTQKVKCCLFSLTNRS